MSAVIDAKREFYRQEDVAERYDRQRYGGRGGAYTQDRETALTSALLPADVSVVADVGCGTGRLFATLLPRSRRVVGVDASVAMLRQVRGKPLPAGELTLAAGDAFAIPLRDASCDALTCMRVLFHFDDPRPLLRELRRAAAAGATLVCDTSLWSPRGLLPLGRSRWGERVWPVSGQRFRQLAAEAGWQVQDERHCFIISPYLYRLAPLPVARALERLEPLARPLLCRAFWSLTAA